VRAKCPVYVDGGALEALIDMNTEATSEQISNLTIENPEAASAPDPDNDIDPSTLPSTSDDEEIDRFKRLVGDLDI